jgi:hypothetical protein
MSGSGSRSGSSSRKVGTKRRISDSKDKSLPKHEPLSQDELLSQDEPLPFPKDEYTVISDDNTFLIGSIKPPDAEWEKFFSENPESFRPSNFLCLVKTGKVVKTGRVVKTRRVVKIQILYIDVLMNRGNQSHETLMHKLQYVLYRLYLLDPNQLENKTLLIDIDSVVRPTIDTDEPGFHYDAVNPSVDNPILQEILNNYQKTHDSAEIYKNIFRSDYTFLHIFLHGKGVGTCVSLRGESDQPVKKRLCVNNDTITFFANNQILHSAPYKSLLFTQEGDHLLKEHHGTTRKIQRVQMVFISDDTVISDIRQHSLFTFTPQIIVHNPLLTEFISRVPEFLRRWMPKPMISISDQDTVCYAAAKTKKYQLKANSAFNIPLQELLGNLKHNRRRIRLVGGKKNKTMKRRRSLKRA